MDFSLTTLFVATSGTLASSGSTQNLTGGQLGVFLPDYTIANSGNIAAAKYIYIAEGRIETIPAIGSLTTIGSKRSDKIAANGIIEWYKVPAVTNNTTQVQSISNLSVECSEQITFSFVLHSSYIDTGFFNGLTRSFVVNTPCCNCGSNPCATVTGAALDTFIDQAVAKANADPQLSQFLIFSRFGTTAGGGAQLIITEKPLTVYGNPCDLEAFPWEYDRLWFRAFVIKGPVTTQDFIVNNACDIVAQSTVAQRSTFTTGSAIEIQQLEKNFYSYQTSEFKSLYKYNSWNQAFVSYTVANTFYDTYYIKYKPYQESSLLMNWNAGVEQDSTVIVAIPTGSAAAFETLLTVYLGAPTSYAATNPTTTTTTSTSSTTTTSTSTLIP